MTKTVFITGASSGIGEALALEFARRGYHLALTARRYELLQQLKDKAHQVNSKIQIEIRKLDVTDYPSVSVIFQELVDVLGKIDLVIINAGISKLGQIGEGHFESARQVIETNVIGAIATAESAVGYFKQRGQGHLVGISSITAVRGLPTAAAYSASKIALSTYLEAARIELSDTRIKVTVLYPGFIDTPMVQKIPFRPFQISAEKAAYLMVKLIERGQEESFVPLLPWALLSPVLQRLPRRVIKYFS
jgi:hypothetical protein